MDILFLVLIGILLIPVFFGLVMFTLNFILKAQFYEFIIFFILGIFILLVYYILGSYIYSFFIALSQFGRTTVDMEIWDNIWYSLFFIFIILMLTVFIKSVKDDGMRWNILIYAIGTLFALIVYTIIYYLYVYYDMVPKLTFYLTITMIVFTAIIMFTKGLSSSLLTPIYILFVFVTLVYLICLFLFLFKILAGCYNMIL